MWTVKIMYIRTISAQILQNRKELSHRLHLYLRNGSTARSFFLTCCCTTPAAICIGSLRSRTQSLETLRKTRTQSYTHVSFHLTQLKRGATSGNTCAFRNVKETKKVNRESCAGTKYTHTHTKKERAEWEEGKRGSTAMLLRSNL